MRILKVGNHEFTYVCDIAPVRTADGSVQQFMPQGRYMNAKNLPLSSYGSGPFCKFMISTRLQVAGVYALASDEVAHYVGETDNLSRRFNSGYGNISPRNCFKGGQDTNCRVNHLLYTVVQAGKRVSLWFFPTDEYKAMEAALREALKLGWNQI